MQKNETCLEAEKPPETVILSFGREIAAATCLRLQPCCLLLSRKTNGESEKAKVGVCGGWWGDAGKRREAREGKQRLANHREA